VTKKANNMSNLNTRSKTILIHQLTS